MASARTTEGELAPSDDTLELARRARDGDGEALGRLLARYESRLRRIVRIRLGARLRADVDSMDIVQSAFVVAVQRFGDLELRDRAGVLMWLSKIVSRQILDVADRFDAQKRAPPGERVPFASGSRLELAASATAPDAAAERSELREALDRAVGELPERDREIVLLRDYHEGDWDFVARETGAGVAAVQRAYYRAWARLRRALDPLADDLDG